MRRLANSFSFAALMSALVAVCSMSDDYFDIQPDQDSETDDGSVASSHDSGLKSVI